MICLRIWLILILACKSSGDMTWSLQQFLHRIYYIYFLMFVTYLFKINSVFCSIFTHSFILFTKSNVQVFKFVFRHFNHVHRSFHSSHVFILSFLRHRQQVSGIRRSSYQFPFLRRQDFFHFINRRLLLLNIFDEGFLSFLCPFSSWSLFIFLLSSSFLVLQIRFLK